MTAASQKALKIFSALVGVTSLAIFAQAVVAGEFVSQDHRKGWIDVHGIVADVVDVLALATMLFALVVVQTFIGHEITDNKQDWLIGIHVPLAFIIFGLAIWLPIQSVALRRSAPRAS
jgi:hypothetical protein